MKPARLFLGVAFAASFGGSLIFVFILVQLSSFMPSFWHPVEISDGPIRNLVHQKAVLACRDFVPVLIVPLAAVMLVFWFDRSQWKTGLGKLTMLCLATFFISLAILIWPLLAIATAR